MPTRSSSIACWPRPHYGERWGRHWLDLARFAESDGFEHDAVRPHAWRYRDYVIRAFNADKPYDRFIREQIAGDELFPGDPDALHRDRLSICSGPTWWTRPIKSSGVATRSTT